MEIWNPTDGAVKLVSDLLPNETNRSLGLNHAQLVPIGGGTELLLYGGYQGSYQGDIWRFMEASSTWEKLGTLLQPREEHAVLAVNEVKCREQEDSQRSLF